MSIGLGDFYFKLISLPFRQIKSSMAKKQRKPTNKAKFSLYLDKDLMERVGKVAAKIDRSTNFVVEKALLKEF